MNTQGKKILAVVAVLALLFIAGIRVAHPQAGLSNALGSAKSGITIYKKVSDVNIGDTIIAKSDDPNASPVLGEVSDKGADYYTIKNGKFLERIPAQNLRGKLLVIVPFLGYPLGVVGL